MNLAIGPNAQRCALVLTACVFGTSACGHKDAAHAASPAPPASASPARTVVPASVMPGAAGRVPLYPSHVVRASTLALGKYEIGTSDSPRVVRAWYEAHVPRGEGGTWAAGPGASVYRYRAPQGLAITIDRDAGSTRITVLDKN